MIRSGTIKHQRRYVTNGREFILRTLHGKFHRGWWYLYERRGRRVVFHDAEPSLPLIKRGADRTANTDPRGQIRERE